jgi:hypothetical protein
LWTRTRVAYKGTAKPVPRYAPLPSGFVGVYRADDGKRWEAYVNDPELVCIGVFNTPKQAANARTKYWEKRATAR